VGHRIVPLVGLDREGSPMTNSDGRRTRTATTSRDSTPGNSMILSEERLLVGTETVPVARVRVRKHLVTEQQTFIVPVTHEEIAVDYEDIPEHDQVPDGAGPLTPDDVEIVRYEERVVITKQIVAVERVRLSRRVVTIDHTAVGDVRRELAHVDQLDAPEDDTL
jgi:uncharacterized protein (TIGR02271 family)